MNKIKYLLGLLLLVLFVPKVYAFTYDIETEVTKGTDNSLYEIRVSLNNIQGTSYGITACSLDIQLEGYVKLNSSIRTLGNWTMTFGDGYVFDTGVATMNNTEMFIIPVKVSGKGVVNLVNIECADYNEQVALGNKSISLKYIDNSSSNTNNNSNNNASDNSNNEEVKDSNCDLADIILSEGEIQFDSGVTEYYVKVSSLDNLIVEPKLASNKASYDIVSEGEKIIINVMAQDGTRKIYTIYVEEMSNQDETVEDDTKNYTPIFIGIICVLVLFNVIRIVKNKKK